ncbi:MAG: hypothetical protein HOP34_12500 [Methylococcaceae bacterium]|nr:hypothetical protein [Methylococcaceae bacterium]
MNKHFSWLALEYPEGINRHFFDAPPANNFYPLRTKALRALGKMPDWIRHNLEARQPPDYGLPKDQSNATAKYEDSRRYLSGGPTRISQLIRRTFEEDVNAVIAGGSTAINLRSVLSIVYDFLTMPDMPGSQAYALLALRNHLFTEIGVVPYFEGGKKDDDFKITDIEASLSSMWTYFRPRYLSEGQGKQATAKKKVMAFLQHFLAMKGILQWHVKDLKAYEAYLANGHLWPREKKLRSALEFDKSPFLNKWPETGELINEIWGLPLPIRGADTLFRGGLKFSSRQGLITAIHGGPGSGKTSLALALGVYLAPFGIRTLFISGEEDEQDLRNKIGGLVPDQVRRLDRMDPAGDWIDFYHLPPPSETDSPENNVLTRLIEQFALLTNKLNSNTESEGDGFYIPKPCRAIIVLDGVHDLFVATATSDDQGSSANTQIRRLYQLIEAQKQLQALVILTTGQEWEGNARLDYLAEVTLHLSHESVSEYGAKPDRRIRLCKARHQLCAAGTHGLQIAGAKGVRFSPQINYQLDRRSLWKMRIPDKRRIKTVLQQVTQIGLLKPNQGKGNCIFRENRHVPRLFANSHIFLNGEGSGGKAALALKIALAPSFAIENAAGAPDFKKTVRDEKVLVVSFLYPKEYYEQIASDLVVLHRAEYPQLEKKHPLKTNLEVIHFYPGHLKPNDLYNRIEWALDEAELMGDPYTCVIIDGIHNVFLQFPEIERYRLIWPQIYNSLRSRLIMTITTHTTLFMPQSVFSGESATRVDDSRSEPLRHALVQKSDFVFEIDRIPIWHPNYQNKPDYWGYFVVKTLSAINQPIPNGHVLWSREQMVFVEDEYYPSCNPTNNKPPEGEQPQIDMFT